MKEHRPKVALREPVRGFFGNKPALDGSLLYALVIDSAAVVFDFNVNVVAAMIGAQHYVSGRRFAAGRAVGALLDAVRHRIADQMYKRIGNLLNDIVVELRFAPGKIQLNVRAGRMARITDGARQSRI